MTFLRTFFMMACTLMAAGFMHAVYAQSCSGNLLVDDNGYYGGFESGSQSIGADKGQTDLTYGSHHGGYQIASEANKPWEDLEGGGYLPLSVRSGNFMMLIHTSNARLWFKTVSVLPGQTYNFCAWIASAKDLPTTGFEVRLRVKYGSTTTIIASSVAQQGRWSQICGTFTVPAGVTSLEFQIVDPFPKQRISNFLFLDEICIQNVVQLNPDINTTYVNEPVSGNVHTNDKVSTGALYGTPVAVAGNPSGAAITMSSNGSYVFTAPTTGVYVYSVPVCSPTQSFNCPVSLLTITVLQRASVNNLPVANTDIAETKMKTAVVLNTLANDAAGNVGGALNPASVTVITAPKNGTAMVNTATGAITYTPNNSFSGNDTLRYSVCEKSSSSPLCATALQIITVKQSGTPNTTSAADDYAATPINTPAAGNVKPNDSDAEGDAQVVTAQTTTVPGKGTLVLNTNGSFTFTPVDNYVGPVSFVYTTCDNSTSQACANATLYLLVQPYSSMMPLPVSLLSFTGKIEEEAVRLRWETVSELASRHFVVEHSTNGAAWKEISTVNAAGNTTARTSYDFSHTAPAKGINLYRLRIVDADGSFTTSNIVSIKMNGKSTVVSNVYPNPFAGSVRLTVYTEAATKVAVQLFDINGKLVQRTEKFVPAGESLITVDRLESLPSGTFILKAFVGESTMTQKIFKQ